MKPVVNKEDDIIKSYLEIREKLIQATRKNADSTYNNIIDDAIENGRIDSILYIYDCILTRSKLSKKCKTLYGKRDKLLTVVDYDFIIHEHREGTMSFCSDKDRHDWLVEFSDENDCDAFAFFEQFELVEYEGSLDDNYDMIIKNIEDGKDCFIRVDSIFSPNLIMTFK